jgi:hypothetical protein
MNSSSKFIKSDVSYPFSITDIMDITYNNHVNVYRYGYIADSISVTESSRYGCIITSSSCEEEEEVTSKLRVDVDNN